MQFKPRDSPFGIHIGDYNNDTKLDVSKTLQVEGTGYIKNLEHGLPVTRRAIVGRVADGE